MNSIDAAECCFMLSTIFAASSLASLAVLILTKRIKKSRVYFTSHSFILFCLFFSGLIISITVMLCFTPWNNFFLTRSINKIFYGSLILISFLIVFFSKYLFIVFFISYCFYAGISYYVINKQCITTSTTIPVTVQKTESVVEVEYVTFSPHLFLPFSQTWITQIKINGNLEKKDLKKSEKNLVQKVFAFLFDYANEKKLVVTIPMPQISPESWSVILSSRDGYIRATLKRLL